MSDEYPRLSNPSKNGRQIGEENVQRLRDYLDNLKAKGGRLPSRSGKPDKSAVARECGFNRQVFYPNGNPAAIELFNQAVIEIGLEEESSRLPSGTTGREEALEKRADSEGRRSRHLEDRLQICEAENLELRRRVQDLEEALRRYRLMEEVLTTNGRRYRP
jgi:hypothetical protein